MIQNKPEVVQDKTQDENYNFQPYKLDQYAQELVLKHRHKDKVLNESHKMRMAVAYGLERFWGEHLRLKRENQDKAQYWKDVWDKLADILKEGGITLPNDDVTSHLPARTPKEKQAKEQDETEKIKAMASKIWEMELPEQRIALMVLTQFCEALVWWTQRFKL
jgi:hypothetical protein